MALVLLQEVLVKVVVEATAVPEGVAGMAEAKETIIVLQVVVALALYLVIRTAMA